MSSWKISNRNRKFDYFDEAEEKKWKEPFYFIQGADIQFGFIARELERKEVITWEEEKKLAENIVERINRMNPKPKFFVMCGDLCDAMPDTEPEMRKMQEADYKKIFSKLDKDIPLICVCGNHDVGNIPTPETVEKYRSSFGDDYFSFWCGGVLFLVINSQYFHDPSQVQHIAEDHSEWIKEKLEEGKKEKKRIVVFQHIPWFLNSANEEASYFTINVEVRKKWLDEFKKAGVEAVFCGHYHRNAGGVYDGVDIIVTSAVGGQLGSDKPGARIVNVTKNKIEHFYHAINDLPLIGEKVNDEAVKELENLKVAFDEGENQNIGVDISVRKAQFSVFSDVNGHKSNHKETFKEVDGNGKVGKISEKVDVNGIRGRPDSTAETELNVSDEESQKILLRNDTNIEEMPQKKQSTSEAKGQENGIDVINTLSGIKYSPLDMAEYIFWTGDEKTVTLAVEEFLEQGLMSKQEAINFLQSLKVNLDFIQAHYQTSKAVGSEISNRGKTNAEHMFLNVFSLMKKLKRNHREPESFKLVEYILPNLKLKLFNSEQTVSPGKVLENEFNEKENNVVKNKSDCGSESSISRLEAEDDNQELTEKLKIVDSLYKEYSLEEVIFQLAKEMFSQSLTKGNAEAQKAFQKFAAFLQQKVEQGEISRKLERKILVVLARALMETVSEHPETINKAKEELENVLAHSTLISTMLRGLIMSESENVKSRLSEANQNSEIF